MGSHGPSNRIGDDLSDLDPAGFFEAQAKTLNAAGVLLRDGENRLLLVRPLLRNIWQLPGGLAEDEESPYRAARREVLEELRLDVAIGRLLCVDYKPATDDRPACVQFVFDGGALTAEQLGAIQVQASEIAEWRATELAEAPRLARPGGPASRLAHAIEALQTGRTVYLEDGQLIA